MNQVERIRSVFREITKRRLLALVAARPDDYTAVEEWILDIQHNTLPIGMFLPDAIHELWLTIEKSRPVHEFICGLCFELRLRAFPTQDDWAIFTLTIAESASTWRFGVDAPHNPEDVTAAHERIIRHGWIIPLVLFEQHTADELGITVATDNLALAKANYEHKPS